MSSEGVQLVYSRVHQNTMVYSLGCLWRPIMEWALSVEKRQNGGRLSQKALGVPLPLQRSRFLRAISGRLGNRFGSPFWKNPKLLRGVIGPISTPNGGGGRGIGGGVGCGNVPVKIMPIISCSKRLSICISIPFHRFGVFIHSIRRKKCSCNLYFPKY